MSALQAKIDEYIQLIEMSEDEDPTLLESLKTDLAILQKQLAEENGVSISEDITGSDLDRNVHRFREERRIAEMKYKDKLHQKNTEEEFRRRLNPSFSWETEPLREEDLRLLYRYYNDFKAADTRLVQVQGATTFRVGFPEDPILDSCFSPALLPTRDFSTIYSMIIGSENPEVEDFSTLIQALAQVQNRAEFANFIDPIVKLAQKSAAANKSASDKHLGELKRTPFDVFCAKLDRIKVRIAKKCGMNVEPNQTIPMNVLMDAIQNAQAFSFVTENINLDVVRKECGAHWDESIMDEIQLLVEAEIISTSTTDVKTTLDLKEMEELYAKMNVRLAHKSDFFLNHPNPEYRGWARDFDTFRRKKEELRVLINSLRSQRAARHGVNVKRR